MVYNCLVDLKEKILSKLDRYDLSRTYDSNPFLGYKGTVYASSANYLKAQYPPTHQNGIYVPGSALNMFHSVSYPVFDRYFFDNCFGDKSSAVISCMENSPAKEEILALRSLGPVKSMIFNLFSRCAENPNVKILPGELSKEIKEDVQTCLTENKELITSTLARVNTAFERGFVNQEINNQCALVSSVRTYLGESTGVYAQVRALHKEPLSYAVSQAKVISEKIVKHLEQQRFWRNVKFAGFGLLAVGAAFLAFKFFSSRRQHQA